MISETEPKQVVYAFNCKDSTLQVKGKVNAITIGKNDATAQAVGRQIASPCVSLLFINFVPFIYFFVPSDACKKMNMVFEDVVGIVEIINCDSVKVQVCRTICCRGCDTRIRLLMLYLI